MQELIEKINNLPPELKNVFDRIYEIEVLEASLKLPKKLRENPSFITASNQQIIVICNKILYQETAFNLWRAKRPEPKAESGIKNQELRECAFCNPRETTPEDEVGRLENEAAITAANLAKSLKYHSLVIFKKHNAEELTETNLGRGLELANLWFSKIVNIRESTATNVNISEIRDQIRVNSCYLIWNQGYRAGASIQHPHFQIFASDHLPEKLSFVQERFNWYEQKFNSSYLDDLYLLHQHLSLANEVDGVRIIASLTPFKDKELIFTTADVVNAAPGLSKILLTYRQHSDSFNFFLTNEKNIRADPRGNLRGSALLGFIVDRGDSDKKNSDIGSLEIYAYSVVGYNPIEFAKEFFGKL